MGFGVVAFGGDFSNGSWRWPRWWKVARAVADGDGRWPMVMGDGIRWR